MSSCLAAYVKQRLILDTNPDDVNFWKNAQKIQKSFLSLFMRRNVAKPGLVGILNIASSIKRAIQVSQQPLSGSSRTKSSF
jgi:hypothetical protein